MTFFEPTWLQYVVLAPIAFAGAFILGVTGFGSALVTIPLASFFVPLPFALAVFALVDWLSTMRVGLQRTGHLVAAEWTRVTSTMVIGTTLGIVALFHLPGNAARLALGCFTFLYALYALVTRGASRIVPRKWAYVAGIGGGFCGTFFGAGGPPYAIYLSHRGLSKEGFRATVSGCSAVSISLRVVGYAIAGLLLERHVLFAALCAAPAALLGLYAGTRVFDGVDRATLARATVMLLLAIGFSLIARAIVIALAA